MSRIEKIEIKPNLFVWVDKDAEIKENDWFYLDDAGIVAQYKNNITNGAVKIIAASPEFNLESVPTYVEWLAEQQAKFLSDYEDVKSDRFCFLYTENEIIEQLKKTKNEI